MSHYLLNTDVPLEHTPAVAIFAVFSRYKREAFRSSEFAARILVDKDIKVVFKVSVLPAGGLFSNLAYQSDHPAIISRYLVHEAQQAHYYGLLEHLALASVTTAPAEVLGLDHRIGFIRVGKSKSCAAQCYAKFTLIIFIYLQDTMLVCILSLRI